MAKQTFTTGQVLTAAQMTSLQANDYNWTVSAQTASYVLIAANAGQHVTMNAAGATTITVNTALFTAGDTLRITNIGAGVCTITAGTATVTSAGPLALTQWASGILYFTTASAAIFFPDAKTVTVSNLGLTCIKAETAFSAASAVTLDNIFTSTYTNYRILFQSATAAGAPVMQFNLRAGGANATTNYTWQVVSFAAASITASQQTATTTWQLGLTTTTNGWWIMDIFNPQLAVATHATTNLMNGNLSTAYQYWSTNTNATSYDGFSFSPSSSTITGSYTVYGYGKSV